MESSQSGGDYGAVLWTVRAGEEPPLHTHSREDELVFVVQGKLIARVGDTRVEVGPGAYAALPRDVPHTIEVVGDQATLLVSFVPGGLERFLVPKDGKEPNPADFGIALAWGMIRKKCEAVFRQDRAASNNGHDPEKVRSGFPTRSCASNNAHDPEKCAAVFRQDHAPAYNGHDPEKRETVSGSCSSPRHCFANWPHHIIGMQKYGVSFREHRELGEVRWLRDYNRALALAAEQGKPVLLLFQEVPGCSTCVRFGQDVLTHPLMVELIADRFVPVAIFNNHPGADAEILRRYDEPSWNNPVVRFLGPDGAELLPKLADRYDALGLHEKDHRRSRNARR